MFAAGWDTAAWALGNQSADTSEIDMPYIADYAEGIVTAMETVDAFNYGIPSQFHDEYDVE